MPRWLRALRHDGRSLNLRFKRAPSSAGRTGRNRSAVRKHADVAHSGTSRGYAAVAGTGVGGKLRGKVFHGALGLTCEQLARSHLRRPTCTEQLASNHLRRPTCAKQFDQSILHGAVCTEPAACTEQSAQSHLQLAQSSLHRATCAEQFAQSQVVRANLHRATCPERFAQPLAQTHLHRKHLRSATCAGPSAQNYLR